MLADRVRVELTDFEDTRKVSRTSLKAWFPSGGYDRRYVQEGIARWLRANAKYLQFLGVVAAWSEDGGLVLSSSNKIGLAPLKNPVGRTVYGSICVKPRTGMISISDVLDEVDWQLQPQFLTEEEPIVADGVLPRWFRAVQTMVAVDRALRLHMTGLVHTVEVRRTPGGGTDWNHYASSCYPRGKHDSFSCCTSARSFDVAIHRQFKGVAAMIEHDLDGASTPNRVRCEAAEMLARIGVQLERVTTEPPSVPILLKAKVPSLYARAYGEAQARCVDYIQQGRISLCAGELGGTPWALDMERLFELWVVAGVRQFARSIGADCYSDLRGTSRIRFLPFDRWRSLRVLKPDVVVEKDDRSLVVDAKYKRHLMHLAHARPESHIEADHRRDLHQVLAYLGASARRQKTAVLLYPQSMDRPVFEVAKVVNYRNTTTDLAVILADVPFNKTDLMTTLERIWHAATEMAA
jgi:hypothetical protein